ncbi:hypothetical protein RUM43_003026 [Polyplax serrata]|uniref:Arf-GAP with Rho-GAP domain, ANK repeat and PH domain-containing protein 2 n=1 Tax=Polyplax serrata TaxID=468196 RepID=A0AAN8NZI8_POLSC
MVNEVDGKPVKKPVPLPRKSLTKEKNYAEETKNVEEKQVCEAAAEQKNLEGKNFFRDDWRSASETFVLEKKKLMKNEVNKFEKSVRNIITRRKSTNVKSQNESLGSEHSKNDSLPDGSVFLNIAFNSPLVESGDYKGDQSTSNSDTDVYEDKSPSPPPYPPPDPPDESLYDQMRSFSLTDLRVDIPGNVEERYFNSSESDCVDFLKGEIKESDSLYTEKGNRYETIDEVSNTDSSEDRYCFLQSVRKPDFEENEFDGKPVTGKEDELDESHKSIIHLFDPLRKNKINSQDGILEFNQYKINSKLQCNTLLPSFNLETGESLIKNSEPSKVPELPLLIKNPKIIPPNLKEGHYGKIRKIKPIKEDLSIHPRNVYEEPPPIPPRTNLKLLLESEEKRKLKTQESDEETPKPDSTTSIPVEEKSKPSDVIQWSSLRRVAKKVADNIENRTSYLSFTGRRSSKQIGDESSIKAKLLSYNVGDICTLPQNFPKHSGVMYRPGAVERWGVLSQRKLTLFANKDSPDVKETVPMDNVLSIQATQNKISGETIGIHCFEISVSTRNQLLLFGVPSISERHIWMRKLLESVGPGFSAKLSMDYTKAGWCYAKTEGFACENVTEKGPIILVDLQGKTLYLQMDYERETKAWEVAITTAALKNGPSLCEQQLTKDDIPAIVEKCLNFVHTHGSLSEGIYRRNGSNRTVSHLLAAFRCNAWSIQLSKDDCSEFDVSSVLKRFFRDLPEPLIVPEIQDELGRVLGIEDGNSKAEKYKAILKKLPTINYLTARRLLGHLYFIDKQKDKNLMGAENLAAIWGPTILQVQEQVSLDSDCFKMETLIVQDLICYYPEIFEVEQAEVEREMKILQMLESYHVNSSSGLNKKPSGELKIWVFLYSSSNTDNCINVSVNPQKTAEEVCKELCSRTDEPLHSLCLEEVISSGHLSRPLNHAEKVLDTVLRWSYWDEADRKDNCLVLKKNDLFHQVVKFSKNPVIISEELKFADQKSKTFKTCQFEFSQAKLICYKDKLCSQKIGEWKVEDIVWYFGSEPKRVPHAKWSITFIEKQFIAPRTKEKPYFGNTICGSSEEQKMKLVTAMLVAQYSKDILPTPNLME